MAYDLKITGGVVVDGTGAARRRADVAIKGGRIVEVGDCAGVADRVIDAEGAIVTPGFVDIHTHYDGQVSWDEELAPSSLHGVTTAVMGSCGVGFAPCRAKDRDRLIDLMEGVEDIPGTALSEGMSWDWESFPEYMAALDAKPHTIDFGCQVPHDALRVYIMGDRAFANSDATDDDIAAMRDAVREAITAGAVGFSTGRTDNHRAGDGSPTPASEATARELAGIAAGLNGLPTGVLQAVSDFNIRNGREPFDREFDILQRMAEAAPGHRMSMSLIQRMKDTSQWRRIIERAEASTERGVPINLQVGARGIGVLLGLEATFHPFMGFPSFKAISHLPLAEQVRRMREPAFKARILSETSDKVAGDGSPIPALADDFLQNLDFIAMKLWRFGDQFNYEPHPKDSILAQALGAQKKPLEVMYDAMLEDDGRELLYFPIYNYMDSNLDAIHEMLDHPLMLPGLSDGGAHVGTICDASFPSFLLSYWTRDRSRGRFPLERMVNAMTGRTAEFIGFTDRGVIAPGMKADINVIDYDNLRIERPRMVRDLPAGGQRLLQDAVGYRATLVSGQVTLEDDQLTGARPGRLARPGL